jgi:hypothetical protein
VAGDSLVFVLAANHEARDVLQEDQRRLALAAQFNEVPPLSADSLNRMPLFAMMPTGMPSMRAKPQTKVVP